MKFAIHFAFLAFAVAWLCRRGAAYYWRSLAWFCGGIAVNAAYGVLQLALAQVGGNLDSLFVSPLTGGASQINIYGARQRLVRLPAERPHRRPEPPRDHADRADPRPHAGLPAARAGPPASAAGSASLLGFLIVVESRRSRAAACSGSPSARSCSLSPYRRYLQLAGAALAARRRACGARARVRHQVPLLRGRAAVARCRPAAARVRALPGLRLRPDRSCTATRCFGLGLNNFSVFYERVTGKTNWGPHSFYVSADRRDRARRDGAVRALPALGVPAAARRARARRGACRAWATRSAARVRPLAWGWTAALAGTMAANVFYLTMQFYYFYAFLALALAVPLVFGGAASRAKAPSGRSGCASAC